MARRLLAGAVALALAAVGTKVSAATVSLSPLFLSYDLPQGATQQMEVAVANPGSEAVDIQLESDRYPSPGDGSPLPRSQSLEPWLYGPAEPITLQPGEAVRVPVELRVPLEAANGSYYGIVAARAVQRGGSISVAGRVATVVLANVGSPLDATGQIDSFSLQRGGERWEATVSYENTGNAHFVPSGTVSFRSWPAGVAAEVGLESRPVLPGTVRPLRASTPRATLGWGVAVATARVVDGNGVVRTAKDVYVPRSIRATLALLTALAVGSTMYVRRRKRTLHGTA
jgi:hypothetical protein